MKRDAQAVLLLLVGGTLLKISFLGTYVNYVRPGLLPLLIGTGVALVAVGAVTLWQALRRPRRPAHAHADAHAHAHAHEHEHDPDDGHGHDHHGHGGAGVGWLLLVPALALLLFAPPALGSFQAGRNGTALSSQADSDFGPLPDGDPVRLSLLDYAARAVYDQGRSLSGRRVVLSGFVIARDGGPPYLARLIVTCCAADARPIKVGLDGTVPTAAAADQWIEIVGSYTDRSDKDAVNGEVIPYVRVESGRAIAAPERQYE